MSIENKTVLITGAARRIGAACAVFLHQAGCRVIVHYHHSAEAAEALVSTFNQQRANSAVCIQANLCNMSELEALAQKAIAAWGGVDVLINNAAQFFPAEVGHVSADHWALLMDSNVKAPFFLSQWLTPTLQSRRGCIINITDIHAETGLPGYPVYSMSKASLAAMTHSLAKALAPEVRVNAIAPGAILWPERAMDGAEQAQILERVALQRCGQADDIARAAYYLIANADYVTGQTLSIDGGRSLFR